LRKRSAGYPVEDYRTEAVEVDPLQVDPPGLAQLIEQERLELVEHRGLGHSSVGRQQAVALPQPILLANGRL
jgi:hypothetical protein